MAPRQSFRYRQPDPVTLVHHARGRRARMSGGASRQPSSLRVLTTKASRPPAFADTFLYHSDTSFGTWALLQHRYAADESLRTCRSTDDEFSQPLRALRDPASTEIVALGRKFMMHAMGAIAGIASAGGQHTRLQTQCVSLRTCSLWRKQTSFMLAMCSEVICTN